MVETGGLEICWTVLLPDTNQELTVHSTTSKWGDLGGLGNDLCNRMCNVQNFVQQDFSLLPLSRIANSYNAKRTQTELAVVSPRCPNRTPVLSVKCGGLGKRSFRLGEEKRQPLLSANEVGCPR